MYESIARDIILQANDNFGGNGKKISDTDLWNNMGGLVHAVKAVSSNKALQFGFNGEARDRAQSAIRTWKKKDQRNVAIETLLMTQSAGNAEAFEVTCDTVEELGSLNQSFPHEDSWESGKRDNNPYLSALWAVARYVHHGTSQLVFAPTVVRMARTKGFETVGSAIEHFIESDDDNSWRRKSTKEEQKRMKTLNAFLTDDVSYGYAKQLWNGNREYRMDGMRELALAALWGNSQRAIAQYASVLREFKSSDFSDNLSFYVGTIPTEQGYEDVVDTYVGLMHSLKDEGSWAHIIMHGQSELPSRKKEDSRQVTKAEALGRSIQLISGGYDQLPKVLATFEKLKDSYSFFDFAEKMIVSGIHYGRAYDHDLEQYQ